MRIVRSLVIAETSLNRGVSRFLFVPSSSTRALLDLFRLQARLEQPGKGRSHVDEDDGPQHSHEERQRKSARGHEGVETKNVDNHRRQHGHRRRHVTVDQQKYTCDELKREDHPQVMRDIKGTHELCSNARRRGKVNEVEEAVQPHNKKDHARQISGDYGSGSHNQFSFSTGAVALASYILTSIKLMMYTLERFRVFYDPRQSRDGPRLASNDEGDARPDEVRNRWY